jgi:uncharacterized OsmC-like protein
MNDPSAHTETAELAQQHDYQFEIRFGDGLAPLLSDEPAPLGAGQGPSPVQLLCAAVGNCLSASLLFALRKFKQQPEPLRCRVRADVGRNAQGRQRVLGLHATLQLGVPAAQLQHLERVLEQFEDYCTVTRSVEAGVPVALTVLDAEGAVLKAPAAPIPH